MTMLKNLRKTIKETANRRGFVFERQISVKRQASLIDALRPVQTEHPLIRLGSDHDGGYLIPDDLGGVTACFSPGVSDNSSFEEAMLERGIHCYQADASVERSPIQDRSMVEFERKFLGPVTEGDYVTLADWVGSKIVTGDLLLQMDIEGAEWSVLAASPNDVLSRFRIICIEFHHLEHIFEPFTFAQMGAVFTKLLALFDVVHAHPNNWSRVRGVSPRYCVPSVLEYTFLRKDRSQRRAPATMFPHPLDQDCKIGGPMIRLPSSMTS